MDLVKPTEQDKADREFVRMVYRNIFAIGNLLSHEGVIPEWQPTGSNPLNTMVALEDAWRVEDAEAS